MDRRGLGVHRIHGALKPKSEQVIEDHPANGIRLPRGADHGDGLGTQDGVERVHGKESTSARLTITLKKCVRGEG